MKIESILTRNGGTKIHFGTPGQANSVEYHFKPDESGRHVAEVKYRAHIDRLLSISEGFRVVIDGDEAPEVDEADDAGEETEEDSDAGDASDDLDILDKHALSKEYERVYGETPVAALSKAKLIEAIRARRV